MSLGTFLIGFLCFIFGGSISCFLFALIVGSSDRCYNINRIFYELDEIKLDLLKLEGKEDVPRIVEKINKLMDEGTKI